MKPPQHRIDATPTLILGDDPAWDMDRLEAELTTQGPHPWRAYIHGETRFDLHAEIHGGTAADYLRSGEQPTTWTLRRLGVANVARVQDMLTREVRSDAPNAMSAIWLECLRHGIAAVDGPGAVEIDERHGRLTEATLDRIFDAHGMDAISQLGAAIWTLSQPLSDAEKKR